MRLITDIFEFCAGEIPSFNTISISGYHIREAGSTAAQEVAFTLGDGIEYVQAAIDAGLDVDEFAPQLSFFFNAHNNIFEEAAKFRAARRMWATIMEERFDAQNPKSKQLKFHTQTGGSTLTAQQIENNVVRVSYQALAAVLGGTQSLHTNGKDEALALPTEQSVRTALRTQQILAHESGAADTIDPLAGSYYVENLTDGIEEDAFEILEEVDRRGGMLEAVKSQWVQRQIQDVAFERQREIEDGERVIVGVNKFEVDEEPEMDLEEVDPEQEQNQRERLEAVKADRDSDAVDDALASLREAAQGSEKRDSPHHRRREVVRDGPRGLGRAPRGVRGVQAGAVRRRAYRSRTAVPYARISAPLSAIEEVVNRTLITPSAPSASASSIMRSCA